jgi:uncharacterized protein (TIGR04222 family)
VRRRVAAAALGGLLLAVAGLLAGAPAAPAQAGERIRSYHVDVVIERDGSLGISEKISYDFGPNQRRGIIREILVRFPYDDRYEQLNKIEDVRVQAAPPGTPDDLKIESAGNFERIRIGHPDRFISGVHDYTINYRVRGAMLRFSEHDELKWNLTGHETSVPIDRVTATVSAPGPVSEVACFAGPLGSQLDCQSAGTDHGPHAAFAHGALAPHEGVTVVVALPLDTVDVPPPILDEKWAFSRAFSVTPLTAGLSAALTLIVGGALARVFRAGRDRRWKGSHVDVALGNVSGEEERVPLFDGASDPVEFEPPDKIRPGQIGALIDEEVHVLDVTATVVDLAVRGYLRIEEIPKKGWFGKPDWRLTKLKEDGGLLPYEAKLFDGIFKEGNEVLLSSLKAKFAARLGKVREALYDDVVKAGWFPTRPDRVRTRWRVIGAIALFLSVAATIVLAVLTRLALLGLPLVLGALVLLLFASKAPHRTPRGYAVLRRVNGFRRFIEESEKERARFAERANLFSEYLPYAIVFGATEKWAKAFEGLETEVAAYTGSWYVSTHPFAMASFADSMDGFAVTTSGTVAAAAPSSSSGFSGGGFSGGGFGGGGTSSW